MTGTKNRILDATSQLIREFGYHGMSMNQVIVASKATAGSVYHFFPEGKSALVAEAIERSGTEFRKLVDGIMEAESTIEDAINAAFHGAAQSLEDADYVDICPIGGIAREVASTEETVRKAAATVFSVWIAALTSRFENYGLEPDEAEEISTMFVAAFEGALVLARTTRTVEPLLACSRSLSVVACKMKSKAKPPQPR